MANNGKNAKGGSAPATPGRPTGGIGSSGPNSGKGNGKG